MVLASQNITFTVISGPGYVQGAHNGDSHNHHPNNAPWTTAWHGLARGFVRVNSVAGRDRSERDLLQQIDVRGAMSKAALDVHSSTDDIVVEVSADGLGSARITIPTSTNAAVDSVNAVASASAGKAVNFFANDRN